MHKTFAQFILYTFRCILIHIVAFWSLRTKCTIFVRKIVNFSLFYWIKTTSLTFLCIKQLHSSYCTHFNAFWWILTHSEHLEQDVENSFFFLLKMTYFFLCAQNASECIKMNFLYAQLSKKLFLLHLNRLKCIKMHQSASKCIKMYLNASKCIPNELF